MACDRLLTKSLCAVSCQQTCCKLIAKIFYPQAWLAASCLKKRRVIKRKSCNKSDRKLSTTGFLYIDYRKFLGTGLELVTRLCFVSNRTETIMMMCNNVSLVVTVLCCQHCDNITGCIRVVRRALYNNSDIFVNLSGTSCVNMLQFQT